MIKLSRHKTVREALQFVSENPDPPNIAMLDMEVWEIVSRKLFEIANNPDRRVRGSIARATRAQRIILNRSTGTRRTGTHPAQASEGGLVFHDLTAPRPVAEAPSE